MLRALSELGSVDCLVVSHDDDRRAATDSGYASLVRQVMKLQPIPPRPLVDRLRCRLDPRFTNYYGHTVSESDRHFMMTNLDRYDLVWFHHLRTANVFGQWSWPHSVLDLDDVPSSFHRSVWEHGPGLKQRLKAGFQIGIERRREKLLRERFTLISVCSAADQARLGGGKQIQVIPNGFSKPAQEPARRAALPPRIGFIGIFEYPPNAAGVRWFAEECWPLIKQQVPDARLRLIGKGSDGAGKPAGADVDGLGWVEDAAAEMATWSAMIVPVRTGAGTRVKVAEGFSRKCPMVSTSLGAFGYEVTDGRELFLADTAGDFANACIKAIRQPAEAAAMAERAWQKFLENWTWEAIRPRVWAAAEECLRQGARG